MKLHSRVNWHRWRACTLPCDLAQPGGFMIALRACAGSEKPQPKPPGSTTPSDLMMTHEHFARYPARHDVSRRVDCAYLATLISTGRLTLNEAHEVAQDLAYGLAKKAYQL